MKSARRYCAYCGGKLPFPFITVWFEEHGRSIGIRFGSVYEMLEFFKQLDSPYTTADEWLRLASAKVNRQRILNPKRWCMRK